MPRTILHLDMDAFYAAVEQRDNPALRGKPVLVGGDPTGRGVVATASYEARPFGCHSAMPMSQALRLCPQAAIVKPRMAHYVDVSRAVFSILERYTPLIEPLSIDEAFLDVTGSQRLFGDGETIARRIRGEIRDTTRLTASVGVAPNKFVAKLASDARKPDGLVVVPRAEVQSFLDALPIGRLWGVGKATLPRFQRLGVRTFGDARRLSLERMRELFGESGEHFHQLLRGDDDRPVVPDREAKSISHETTFAVDLDDREALRGVLLDQIEHVAERLRRHERMARCVVLKIRTPDFSTYTRRKTLDAATDVTGELWQALAPLFEAFTTEHPSPVRLIGTGVTQLTLTSGQQLGLFDHRQSERGRQLDRAVDEIRERFGGDALVRGINATRTEPHQPE